MSRSTNGIYKLNNLPFSSRDFHKKFTLVSGPLSLFDAKDDPEEGNENPDIARPLTPIEDAIKGPISSFSSFSKLIRLRLTPKEAVPGLSVSDQQELIGVIMNEINNVWADMKSIPPDPFLNHQENMELQRRLAIEIVTLAQSLFLKFLQKAQRLHERGVFSGPANMSRLKTQLALEANKSFNVLSIRRNLAIDMKHPCDMSTISSTRLAYMGVSKAYKPLVVRQVEAKNRLTKEELLQQRIKSEISDLKRQMPSLKADFFVDMIPEEIIERSRKPTPSIPESVGTQSQPELIGDFMEEEAILYEKCVSEPGLPTGDSLLDELGLTEADVDVGKKGLPRSTSVNKIEECILSKQTDGRVSTREIKLGTPDFASNDLRKLIASRVGHTQDKKVQDDSDDLPPLLQALEHYSTKRHEKFQEDVDNNSMCSDDGSVIGSTKASSVAVDRTVIDESITEFTGEEHPQPAVVSLRLPDKSVVRASDVRVSNRVNKSSLVLQKYPTIYNDLTGEDYTYQTSSQFTHSLVSIDAATVKWLDRNLFIGEEIREVYQEIIRTMNTDFLHFDKDPYVEKWATDIDLSLCNASTSLMRSKKDRVMNPKLHKDIPPPWGSDTADTWRNKPKFGGLGREDIIQTKINKENEGGKSYNSWLAWWRSTINFDDYLKYMSNQDNDFLSMLYHLYDSESDSDDEGSVSELRPTTVQLVLGRERERMLTKLKAKKTEYKTGYWNANSVLLGGLGQDPVVDEEELLSVMEGLGGSGEKDQGTASQVSFSSDKKSYASSASNNKSVGHKNAPSVAGKSDVSSKERSLSFQERLERIWTVLCMPNVQRLDMAIKYSGETHKNKLREALTAWEAAATAIIERESLLTKLENFERNASNPNRFFEKGDAGTSLSRIRESKARDSFDKEMSELDREVKRTVALVKRRFGDQVTFQGRPYLEKLRHDRTEMLYWLQQERRQQVLNQEMMKEVPLTFLELPPLSANSML